MGLRASGSAACEARERPVEEIVMRRGPVVGKMESKVRSARVQRSGGEMTKPLVRLKTGVPPEEPQSLEIVRN